MSDLLVRRSAVLSDDGLCRFEMTREWHAGGATALFVGNNPSTADDEKDDPTSKRWEHFARGWGYARYVAVNRYPFRTPSPAVCRRAVANLGEDDLHAMWRNIDFVRAAASRSTLIVVCWGVGASDDAWTDRATAALLARSVPLHCFGTTADGHPIHPMARGRHRVPDDAQPTIWMEAMR